MLLQCYEVLWIHNIDAICTKENKQRVLPTQHEQLRKTTKIAEKITYHD